MNTITIYGASDDLIELEGAIREEFYALEDGRALLAFSDGTVLSVTYDDNGMWRINRLADGGRSKYEKTEATDPKEDYTDRVTLTGDFTWVMCGLQLVRVK